MGLITSMCRCIVGIFDWYGGRWDRTNVPTPEPDEFGNPYPNELWCEAYALARYPSRYPDGADHDQAIGTTEEMWQTDSSQDDGWEAPYVVHSPGTVFRTIAPWDVANEYCCVVRHSVYELTLHDDLLGDTDDWTVGNDATYDDGTNKLAVKSDPNPANPTSEVTLSKSFTIVTGDEGYYILRLKASVSGLHNKVAVTFKDIGGIGVDETIYLDLLNHLVESSDAERAEWIEYLSEYRIRFDVTDPETTSIEIKIVDGDGETELTDPVEGDGIIITSCTLQWEELPADEITILEFDPENEFDDTPTTSFSYQGYDVTLFDCNDDAKEIIWRRFIPATNDYHLYGPVPADISLADWSGANGTVINHAGPAYHTLISALTIPNRRSIGLQGAVEGAVESVDIHGTFDGNCLEGGTCAANDSEFHFYTGEHPTNTEAIVIIKDDPEDPGQGTEEFLMGLANNAGLSPGNWFPIEYTSHIPNEPVDLGVVGTFDEDWDDGPAMLGGATLYYQQAPEILESLSTKIPRLLMMYHRAAGQGQGARVPILHYHEDSETGPPPVPGSYDPGYVFDPDDPHNGFPFTDSVHMLAWPWYVQRNPTDYIALTAGSYAKELWDWGAYPQRWCFAGGINLEETETDESYGSPPFGREDIPILCGPRGVLWDDEQSPNRIVYFTIDGFDLTTLSIDDPPVSCNFGTTTRTNIGTSGPSTVGFHLMRGDHAGGGPTHASIFTHYRDEVEICGVMPEEGWISWVQLWGVSQYGIEDSTPVWLNDNEPQGDPETPWSFNSDPGIPYEIKNRRYWLKVVIGVPDIAGGVGDNNVVWDREIFSKKAYVRHQADGLSALQPSAGEELGGYMFFTQEFDPDDQPRIEDETFVPATCGLTGFPGDTGNPGSPGTYLDGTIIALKQWYYNNDGSLRWSRSIPVYTLPIFMPDVTSSSTNYLYLTNWPDWSLVDIATTEPEEPVDIPISGAFDDCEIIYSTAGTYNADYIAVTVWIEHEHVGDLEVRLVDPDDNVINLAMGKGDDGVNFTATRFIQEAEERLPNTGTGDPFTGDWIPDQAGGFTDIAGITATGDWKVQVRDTLASMRTDPVAGSFVKFKLELGMQQYNQWATSHDLNEDTGQPRYRWIPKVDGGFGPWWPSQFVSPEDPEEADSLTGYTLWDTNKHSIEKAPGLANLPN